MSNVTFMHESPAAKRTAICRAIGYAANRSRLPLRTVEGIKRDAVERFNKGVSPATAIEDAKARLKKLETNAA